VAVPRYDTRPARRQPDGAHDRDQDQERPARLGCTLSEIDKLARTAIAGKLLPGIDRSDAYEVAWSASIERLYAATTSEPPWPGRLVWDAREALSRLLQTERRHHGIVQKGGRRTAGFERYWDWHARGGASPEDVVVDQLALAQVWPCLTKREQHALVALAATGSHQAAAAALGWTMAAFYSTTGRARRRLLALWYEHETPPPPRPWRSDQQRAHAEAWRRRHDHATCGCAGCSSARGNSLRWAKRLHAPEAGTVEQREQPEVVA